MGAPKQRWSKEEEDALKAGIVKHGAGKWTTILKDPEFRSVLALRSNVDLKDKFRNMGTVRSGERSGEASREKAAAALKRSKQNLMQDSSQLAPSGSNEDHPNEEYPDAAKGTEFLTGSVDSPELPGQNKQKSKLETLILEAIACMKERTGSSITNISSYIEDNLKYFPESKQEIGDKIKEMASAGKLEKVKHRYKLARNTNHSKGKLSKARSKEGRQKEGIISDGDVKNMDGPSNDAEMIQFRDMAASDVAAKAAQAVVKAEALMAEAEEAQKQLGLAEASANASYMLLKCLEIELNRRNMQVEEMLLNNC